MADIKGRRKSARGGEEASKEEARRQGKEEGVRRRGDETRTRKPRLINTLNLTSTFSR